MPQGLADVVAEDGELWMLRVTKAWSPGRRCWPHRRGPGDAGSGAAVLDEAGPVLGSTSYHDIAPEVHRLEIGYTWYLRSVQRIHVNTACKPLLLTMLETWMPALPVGAPTMRTLPASAPSNDFRSPQGRRTGGTAAADATQPGEEHGDVCSMLADEWPRRRSG